MISYTCKSLFCHKAEPGWGQDGCHMYRSLHTREVIIQGQGSLGVILGLARAVSVAMAKCFSRPQAPQPHAVMCPLKSQCSSCTQCESGAEQVPEYIH